MQLHPQYLAKLELTFKIHWVKIFCICNDNTSLQIHEKTNLFLLLHHKTIFMKKNISIH